MCKAGVRFRAKAGYILYLAILKKYNKLYAKNNKKVLFLLQV